MAQGRVVAQTSATPYRVADLRYRILRGPFSLETLRILEWRDITVGEWRVRFHILGASHAVQLRRGDEILTELLACLPADDQGAAEIPASATSLLLAPPTYGQLSRHLPDDAIAGRVSLDRFAIQAVSDALIGDFTADCRLTKDFPLLSAGLAVPPRTRIGWRVEGMTLEIETVHTYPEENAGLRSRTTFLLGEAGQ